jgi:hypothetical protein
LATSPPTKRPAATNKNFLDDFLQPFTEETREDHFFIDEPLEVSEYITLPPAKDSTEVLGSHLNKHLQLLLSDSPSHYVHQRFITVLLYPVEFSNGNFYIPYCSTCNLIVSLQTLFQMSSSFPYVHNVFSSACEHVLAAISKVFHSHGIVNLTFLPTQINTTLLAHQVQCNSSFGWFTSSTFSSMSFAPAALSYHLHITPNLGTFLFRWNNHHWYCMQCKSNTFCSHLSEFDLPQLHKLKKISNFSGDEEFESDYLKSCKLYPGTSWSFSNCLFAVHLTLL